MLIDRNRNCIERIRDCILHCKRQSNIHCILPRTEEKKATYDQIQNHLRVSAMK